MNSANEVQESIKIALDAADAATDVTSEYNKIKSENKKLEASVKQIHKFTTIIFGVSILAAVIGLSLTALIYSRTMNELTAMTSTSREALVVFAENVEGVKTALQDLEKGIDEQAKILETNNAIVESINNLDKNVTTTNNLLVSELTKLTESFSVSFKSANNKNINELKKVVSDLKKTQIKTTKQMSSLAKKSTNKGILDQMSSNQKKLNKNFNQLAKAVNNLANQSSELAKSFKDSSYVKFP
jgi:ABC-type transporter Mla subunit MlaD